MAYLWVYSDIFHCQFDGGTTLAKWILANSRNTKAIVILIPVDSRCGWPICWWDSKLIRLFDSFNLLVSTLCLLILITSCVAFRLMLCYLILLLQCCNSFPWISRRRLNKNNLFGQIPKAIANLKGLFFLYVLSTTFIDFILSISFS